MIFSLHEAFKTEDFIDFDFDFKILKQSQIIKSQIIIIRAPGP